MVAARVIWNDQTILNDRVPHCDEHAAFPGDRVRVVRALAAFQLGADRGAAADRVRVVRDVAAVRYLACSHARSINGRSGPGTNRQ